MSYHLKFYVLVLIMLFTISCSNTSDTVYQEEIVPKNISNFKLSQTVDEDNCATMKEIYSTTPEYEDSKICYKERMLTYIDNNNTIVLVILHNVFEGKEAYEADLLEFATPYRSNGMDLLRLEKGELMWFTDAFNKTTLAIVEGEQWQTDKATTNRFGEPSGNNPVTDWFLNNYPPAKSRMNLK